MKIHLDVKPNPCSRNHLAAMIENKNNHITVVLPDETIDL